MRIGLLTGEYAPMQGGVGDFSRELSLALARLGHEVHILTRVGCRPDGLAAGCTLAPEIRRWSWSISSQISRWVRKHDLEIVIIHSEDSIEQNTADLVVQINVEDPSDLIRDLSDRGYKINFRKRAFWLAGETSPVQTG